MAVELFILVKRTVTDIVSDLTKNGVSNQVARACVADFSEAFHVYTCTSCRGLYGEREARATCCEHGSGPVCH